MRAKSGFTLVEILIVVVILGILAAIVIPQFTGASTEAKESALVSDLQAIRSQIELYKIQHNDELPGVQLAGAACTGDDFATAMTSKTNQDGEVGDTSTHRFGPYMQKIPTNPFSTAVAGESSVGTGVAKMPVDAVGDNATAWFFVISGVDAGLFQANDDKQNAVTDDYHTNY